MSADTEETLRRARQYLKRGFAAIPIPSGQKNPGRKGWQAERHTVEDVERLWTNGQNVGVILGEPSGWAVDVDLDVPEAVALGPRFLPPTLRSGRESEPLSHWWYRCEGVGTEKYSEPGGKMLLEIRSTGCQTVVEPSLHPSGDRYLWETGESTALTEIEPEDLRRACRLLATATLVARRLPPVGGRHEYALALAGYLLREDRLGESEVLHLLESAWAAGGGASAEAERDLYGIVRDTARNLSAGREVVGGGRLDEIAPGLPRIVGRWWGWGNRERYEGLNPHDVPREERVSEQEEPGEAEGGKSSEKYNQNYNPPKTLPEATPFPISAMPPECRRLIEEAEAALGCAPELVGLPMLAALSSAIGASRIVEIKGGWREGATLFLATVADPGAMKTPSANVAVLPAKERQRRYKAEYAEKKALYDEEKRMWEAEKRALKKGEVAPPEPESPTMERSWAGDTTFEALVMMLSDNPRGLLVYKDELSGWVKSMDQYRSGGKGSDRQNWLSLWSNDEVIVDRKSQGGEPIILSKPFVSLCGGIQPMMLKALGDGMEDGLMDRFLFGYPARRLITYNRNEVTETTRAAYAKLYEDLSELTLLTDEHGDPNPKPLMLTHEAEDVFARIIDGLAAETVEPGFPARLEGVWSKMRGYAARLSLVLACSRCVRENLPERIEAEDVENASLLLSYFKAHARRVYGELRAPDQMEVLAGEVKDFLVENEGSWVGSATELYEELEDREAEGLPENPEWLSKTLKAIAGQSHTLEAVSKRKNVGGKVRRVLSLSLKETTVHTVHTVHTPDESMNSMNSMNSKSVTQSEENTAPLTQGRPPISPEKCIHEYWGGVGCYLCDPQRGVNTRRGEA